MKHFRMLAAGLCSAVLLCGFAIPAYAYSDGGNEEPPVVEETPAPEPAPTITPGEGFSEDGNLVTRDLLYDAATNKPTAATPFTLSLTMTSLWTRTANSITPTF